MRPPTAIDIQIVNSIVERIRPYLAGERPEIQGAVLAELQDTPYVLASDYDAALERIAALEAENARLRDQLNRTCDLVNRYRALLESYSGKMPAKVDA